MTNLEDLKKVIIENLREVYDPEIPINVYDLGLIYEINLKDEKHVHILMSLTSPTCPTAEFIQTMIEDAVRESADFDEVDVELTFEPMWTPDRVSVEAREELGLELPTEDLAAQSGFIPNETKSVEEHICFNCAVSEKERPLLKARFKGEEVLICTHCLSKF